ncbi:MAG: hypothetical protein JO144_17110, partial [Actinobacteria bacterium]|nr:hypothetical protein [Actinomycetota bacterium]
MTARGRKPARGGRPLPAGAEPEQPSAEATPATGSFVPLAGLAVAGPASSPEQLRTGLRSMSARPKLLVGAAGDPAELAADALADAVVHRMLQPSSEGSGIEGSGIGGSGTGGSGTGGSGIDGSATEGSPPATRVLGALRRTLTPDRSAPGTGTGS